ncbi:hypothetical protein SSTU70S_02840 [Stutzerimonas stutzeri]
MNLLRLPRRCSQSGTYRPDRLIRNHSRLKRTHTDHVEHTI